MMAMMRIASTSDGMAMIRSMTRMMKHVDERRRRRPAARPSATPATMETAITARPMNSETRAPYIRRESMSRPTASVPRMKRGSLPSIQKGGSLVKPRYCSMGECGASTLAKIATKTTMQTTARPSTAPRFSRKARQKARKGPGGAGPVTGVGMAASLGMADSRVDEAIEQVDDQVDHDDDRRRSAGCRPAAPDNRAARSIRSATCRRPARRRSSPSARRRRAARRPAGRSR